jgi:hypothetical protein
MKAKLLKKVRKRYSIVRIDELSSNPTEMELWAVKHRGLPFYRLTDYNDCAIKYFKTEEESITVLKLWIIADYGEKFRHKDTKQTKVWYSEQVKKKRKFKLF